MNCEGSWTGSILQNFLKNPLDNADNYGIIRQVGPEQQLAEFELELEL